MNVFNSHTDEKDNFVNSTLERFKFFRQIQILPLASVFDFEGWMENFSGIEEKYIAAKILSGFMYYERGMVNRLLYDAIGNVIADILKFRKSDENIERKSFIVSSQVKRLVSQIADICLLENYVMT